MNQRLLSLVNHSMLALFLFVCLWTGSVWVDSWSRATGTIITQSDTGVRPIRDPFAQQEEHYQQVTTNLLALDRPKPDLSLPDLSPLFTFTGSNARPDANPDKQLYYILLKGDKEPMGVYPEHKQYLLYNVAQSPPRYIWSPGNRETRLWLQVESQEEDIKITIHLQGLEGKKEKSFVLKEQPNPLARGTRWMLDQLRVDGTLLARQKGRWYGYDLFFQDHGGEEFTHLGDLERVDFGDGENRYSIWLETDQCMVWDQGRWQEIKENESSEDKPLLCVKNIGDKVMTFHLWDVGGNRKSVLNMIKSSEIWQSEVLAKQFRFVGARTRTQSIVEIQGVRTTLRLFDWLILVNDQWKKLNTPELIDDYVERRLIGPLFIFEGIEKIDGSQWLKATLYNQSRTAKQEFYLGTQEKDAIRMLISEPVTNIEENILPFGLEERSLETEDRSGSHRLGIRGQIPYPPPIKSQESPQNDNQGGPL